MLERACAGVKPMAESTCEGSTDPDEHAAPVATVPPAARAARMARGVAAVTTAVVLLASAGSALAVVLEVLLGLAGLDLAVTGAAGHCLLYQRLGHVPARLRRTS